MMMKKYLVFSLATVLALSATTAHKAAAAECPAAAAARQRALQQQSSTASSAAPTATAQSGQSPQIQELLRLMEQRRAQRGSGFQMPTVLRGFSEGTSFSLPTLPRSSSSSIPASSSSSSVSSSSSSASTQPSSDVSAQKQRILDLVNAERAKQNLPAMRWNDRLAVSAQSHAEDMRNRNYFAHVSPEGTSPTDRIKAAGYGPTCTNCQWSASYGENIARGQRTPEQVMSDWMNSPGHRANILSATFDEIGVGITGDYWVQNFGHVSQQ